MAAAAGSVSILARASVSAIPSGSVAPKDLNRPSLGRATLGLGIATFAATEELQRRVEHLEAEQRTNQAKLTALAAIYQITYNVGSNALVDSRNTDGVELMKLMLEACRELCHEKGLVPPSLVDPSESTAALDSIDNVRPPQTNKPIYYS